MYAGALVPPPSLEGMQNRQFITFHQRQPGNICFKKPPSYLAGQKQSTIILKIFAGTLRPCLEDVEEWLGNACLPSTHQEFFIRQGVPSKAAG
jgi:hypothetical protein